MVEEISSVIQEYLEVIYRLQERNGVARTGEIVRMLNVAPGTITNTVERLERESLIVHEPYRGVKLTDRGHRVALKVIRKHRLSERLLTDVLKVDWDKAHDAACKLEHGISDDVARKMDEALGHPMTCPHGNPIPTEDGSVIEESFQPLTKFDLQEKVTIVKIGDESPDLLRYLDTLGVKPYAAVEVVEKAPFDGPLTIRVDGKDHALSRRIAELIKVQRVEA